MAITMRAKDTISSKLAECYVTIGNNRYNFMTMKNFEAKFETVSFCKSSLCNKSTGWKGTWTANMHYNTSIMRQLAVEFKNTGADMYFEIQISNEDPSSSAGRQTMTFLDCNFDSLILAKFDATSDEPLDEDMSGTFEDFEMPESFNLLDGMLTN